MTICLSFQTIFYRFVMEKYFEKSYICQIIMFVLLTILLFFCSYKINSSEQLFEELHFEIDKF